MDEKIIEEKFKDVEKKLENIEKMLKVLTKQPELIKNHKTTEVKKSGKKGPKYQIEELINEDFFVNPKSMRNILNELKNKTFHYKPQDLTLPLRNLVREKKLRRVEQKNDKDKTVLHWVNW